MALYVLTLRGIPVAAAWRFERLNEKAADYTADEQKHLLIREVDVLT